MPLNVYLSYQKKNNNTNGNVHGEQCDLLFLLNDMVARARGYVNPE